MMMRFCTMFEALCGKEKCTPNMHLHGHLQDCILDYGPVFSFWCFSFERYNGIMGDYHTNNINIGKYSFLVYYITQPLWYSKTVLQPYQCLQTLYVDLSIDCNTVKMT